VAFKILEVEVAGIEPASKHIRRKLSTCLFTHCFVGIWQGRNKPTVSLSVVASVFTHRNHEYLSLWVYDSAAGVA